MEQFPVVTMRLSELRNLHLDHRGGYLLSLVDGKLSVREILDLCGLPEAEALKWLTMLQVYRVIKLQLGPAEHGTTAPR
jgi:hypothetical protein